MSGYLGSNAILQPVVGLVVWSLIVMLWMYCTRFPAMRRAGIDLKGRIGTRGNALDGVIEDRAQWKAHNYNHLMEQPTLFYAIATTLALLGHGGGLTVAFGWAYVALRVVHSLIQGTVNVVHWRFLTFSVASLCLFAMTLEAAMVLLRPGFAGF